MNAEWVESGKAYVNHYRVLELFKELTTALIADQPEDPYLFITNTLSTLRREANLADTTVIDPRKVRSHIQNAPKRTTKTDRPSSSLSFATATAASYVASPSPSRTPSRATPTRLGPAMGTRTRVNLAKGAPPLALDKDHAVSAAHVARVMQKARNSPQRSDSPSRRSDSSAQRSQRSQRSSYSPAKAGGEEDSEWLHSVDRRVEPKADQGKGKREVRASAAAAAAIARMSGSVGNKVGGSGSGLYAGLDTALTPSDLRPGRGGGNTKMSTNPITNPVTPPIAKPQPKPVAVPGGVDPKVVERVESAREMLAENIKSHQTTRDVFESDSNSMASSSSFSDSSSSDDETTDS